MDTLKQVQDYLHRINKLENMERENQVLRKQVSEMAMALEKIANIDYRGPMPDGVAIARAAIAKAKGGK